jgi:hypothetical protein
MLRRYLLPMTARDLLVVGGCVVEPTSLPAFWHLAKCLGRTLERHRSLMARRPVSDARQQLPQPAEAALAAYAGGAD